MAAFEFVGVTYNPSTSTDPRAEIRMIRDGVLPFSVLITQRNNVWEFRTTAPLGLSSPSGTISMTEPNGSPLTIEEVVAMLKVYAGVWRPPTVYAGVVRPPTTSPQHMRGLNHSGDGWSFRLEPQSGAHTDSGIQIVTVTLPEPEQPESHRMVTMMALALSAYRTAKTWDGIAPVPEHLARMIPTFATATLRGFTTAYLRFYEPNGHGEWYVLALDRDLHGRHRAWCWVSAPWGRKYDHEGDINLQTLGGLADHDIDTERIRLLDTSFTPTPYDRARRLNGEHPVVGRDFPAEPIQQ